MREQLSGVTLGSILAGMLSGLLKNILNKIWAGDWQDFINYLKKGDAQVNRDLQKAVKRALFRARLQVALECRNQLAGQFPTLVEIWNEDVRWLNQHINSLAKETLLNAECLGKKDEEVELTKEEFDEISSLLTPQGKLAANVVQQIKDKFLEQTCSTVAQATVAACYGENARRDKVGLFEYVCLCFADEIKNNQPVRDIFQRELLLKINARLTKKQQVTLENLETSLRDVAADVPPILGKDKHQLLSQMGLEFAPTVANNIPRSGAGKFVGRSLPIAELHEMLLQNDLVAIAAVAGIGGVGKTELAIQYALQHLENYTGGICWLRAGSDDLGSLIIEFAEMYLNLSVPQELWGKQLTLEQQVAWCWNNWPLPPGSGVLVVFDDVTDFERVKPYLPPAFKVLMTTRMQWLGHLVEPLLVNVLDEIAALELLRSLVGTKRIERELDRAKALCAWLGFLPLGVQMGGRYLARKPNLSLAEMQEQLEAKGRNERSLLRVRTAFELIWEDLNDGAKQLSIMLSLFALEPIPWPLVEFLVGQAKVSPKSKSKRVAFPTKTDVKKLAATRDNVLVNLNLLQRIGEETYRMHPLIREFLLEKLEASGEADSIKQAFCQVMVASAKQIPAQPTREVLLGVTPAIPHLAEVATNMREFLRDEDLIWPLTGLGRFYQGEGDYEKAESWLEKCVEVTRDRIGAEHPDVATSLNNLGDLYKAVRRYSDAETLYLEALELRKRSLKKAKNADVAQSLKNLADLYYIQRRYSEAEPFYLENLKLQKRQRDDGDPEVAATLNRLANIYQMQNLYAEAERLYLEALELQKRPGGEVEPVVATLLHDLAYLYQVQGRYADAENLYRQALELQKLLLGEDRDVAITLKDMASMCYDHRRYSQTEALLVQALEICVRRLGEAHVETVKFRKSVEGIRSELKRYNIGIRPKDEASSQKAKSKRR